MLGHAGAIFTMHWAVIGDLGADVWDILVARWGQRAPRWRPRRPGGACRGVMVNVPVWGPYSLLNTASKSKNGRFLKIFYEKVHNSALVARIELKIGPSTMI